MLVTARDKRFKRDGIMRNQNRNIMRFSTVKFLISINGFLQAKSNFSQRVIKNVSQCFFFSIISFQGFRKGRIFSYI